MQNKMQNVLALGLVALVAADNPTTIVGTGNNIFPTQFPVTAFPETTQTHFDSPACSTAPSSKTQELTVNYNVRWLHRKMNYSRTDLTHTVRNRGAWFPHHRTHTHRRLQPSELPKH